MDTAYSVYRELLIWDNKNRRSQIIKKQRHTLVMAASLLSVLVVIMTIMCTTIKPKACTETPNIKYYTTHTVGLCDSMYEIAQQYISEEYEDTDQYINEVCRINHIEDPDSIQTGEMLIVPYYSSEFKN